jgi:hypothetical protein
MTDEQLFVLIPIVLLYVFMAFTRDAILFSDTILGKCLAISLIVFYSQLHTLYGVLACVLVLVYYQTDLVEDILRTEHSEMVESRLIEMNQEIQQNWGEPLWARADAETTIAKNVIAKLQIPEEKSLYEGFQSNDTNRFSYTNEPSVSKMFEREPEKPDKKTELMEIFRKENCVKGVLMHKGAEVQPEMAQHIFRELKPSSEWAKCNPCDPTCDFSIIEQKITAEARIKPVPSNDFFNENIQKIQDAFSFSVTNDFLSGYFGGVSDAGAPFL